MRRTLSVLAAGIALLLSACRVDTAVDVQVQSDGTGTITVTATADAEVVQQAPGLADDLRLDDAVAAGWVLDGPTPTDSGGLTVTLTHSFLTVEEASALLRSVNGPAGPLHDLAVTRAVSDAELTTSLTGSLQFEGGLDALADADLLAVLEGTPYADNLAARGLQPGDAFGFTFTATLPGASPQASAFGDLTPLSWTVPLDGSAIDVSTVSVLPRGTGSGTWGVVADVAEVLLVVWCVASVGFIVFVARARRARAERHRTLSSR